MAYATIGQLKSHIDKVTSTDDTVLTTLLEAATINIDRALNHYIPGYEYFDALNEATARIYPGSGLQYQRIEPCVEITQVDVKDSVTDTTYTAWVPTDWIPYSGSHTWPNFNDLPYTAIMIEPAGNYSAFTSGRYGARAYYFSPYREELSPARQQGRMVPTVQVTARWGFSETPPADIVAACLEQAARWYKREQSAQADVLASDELGTLLYRKRLDPDIARKLIDGRYLKPALGNL